MSDKITQVKLDNQVYDIAVENIIQKVDTIEDVENSELNLFKYTQDNGVSSPIIEVVSEFHEGDEANEYRKTTTKNNIELNTTTILSHLDTNLSKFVTISEVTKVWALYQAFNGEPIINGFRLGSGSTQGILNFNLVQEGNLLVTRYYAINGSTGEIASNGDNSQVIVDGTTYLLPNVDEVISIPLSAGAHTLTSGSGESMRAIFLGFNFGGESFYTYEKKYLARQEDITELSNSVEATKTELSSKIITNEKAIQKNAQDIATIDSKIGEVQIYDVKNSLPKASMSYLDEIYRLDQKLYQCVQLGDGVHKDFVFNLSGTSEIKEDHLEAVSKEIAKDFEDFIEIQDPIKLFRNDGNLKLGSSKVTGEIHFNNISGNVISGLKLGLKAYNSSKSIFIIELSINDSGIEQTILVEDSSNETIVDLNTLFNSAYWEGSDTLYLSIWTSESMTKADNDGNETTIYADPRGCITRLIADFGDVTYEWTPVSSTRIQHITYDELKDLRDNSKLIPGQQYRIIDYVTTTTQENTQSAGHQFDIIVTADDEKTLNENARAVIHEGDDYFQELVTEQKIISASWKSGVTLGSITEEYKLSDDNEQYSTPEDEDKEFTEMLTITNKDGVEVPCLFNPDPDEQGNNDYLVYCGVYEQNNITYDKWQECDSNGEPRARDGSFYILTNNLVDAELEYFNKFKPLANLAAWKLKYSLDNDTSKYAWADETNGKGVIYWLKDEWNNECPYDFKNILFTGSSNDESVSFTNAYTFTYTRNSELKDASLAGLTKECYNNVIKEYYDSNKLQLNWNIFYSTNPTFRCYSNTFGRSCYDNTFEDCCDYNTFGNECHDNTLSYGCCNNIFEESCYKNRFGENCCYITFGVRCHNNVLSHACGYNTFGTGCYNNIFGNSCERNTFGNSCDYNTFGDDCGSNTFGYNCSNNTFGYRCCSNTFGDDCGSNTFGDYCERNIFGYYCYSNTFGDWCTRNTFGNFCDYNTFGDNCGSNTFGYNCDTNTFGVGCGYNRFGNECYKNTFGNWCSYNTFGCECRCNIFGTNCRYNTFGYNCQYNSFGTADGAIDYCQYNIFDSSCSYLYINSTDTAAASNNYLQNVHVHLGVNGSSSENRLTITVPDRWLEYEYNVVKAGTTTVEI